MNMIGTSGKTDEPVPLNCGIIMPISAIDGCSPDHWSEVKSIISESVEAISDPKFSVKLVSDSDDIGVIQKRIVQNIYGSDIIICDVSGKNPNVMFELGLRLAFDKPTVIVKDDKTDYSFDTGIIEHVPYPRDLRFTKMVTFKYVLAEKVLATHKAALANPNHSTFLKNFGTFHVASISQDVVPADRAVVAMLSDLQQEIAHLRRTVSRENRKLGADTIVSEAVVKIIAEIQRYLIENPHADVGALIGSSTFATEMEDRCSAPRFFPGPSEFKAALDRCLRDFARSNDQANLKMF